MKNSPSTRIASSKDLGVVLVRARKSRRLSQRDVASQLGVTQKWISSIEQGKSRAWIDKVLELAYFLGVQLHATSSGQPALAPKSDVPSIADLLDNEI